MSDKSFYTNPEESTLGYALKDLIDAMEQKKIIDPDELRRRVLDAWIVDRNYLNSAATRSYAPPLSGDKGND